MMELQLYDIDSASNATTSNATSSASISTRSSAPPLSDRLRESSILKLSMTRRQFRLHSIRFEDKVYQNIYVGAIIFRGNKLLLLKHCKNFIPSPSQSQSASEKMMVSYDIPVRKVLADDESLAHALNTLVVEQTGLEVKEVKRELFPLMEFKTERIVSGMTVRCSGVQLLFFVDVGEGEGEGVMGEYGVWVGEKEERRLEMPEDVRGLVRWAFVNELIAEDL